MRIEVPVCTRSCFCLPLRYGLVTWGYVRLTSFLLFLFGAIWSLKDILQHSNSEIILRIIFLIVYILDFIFIIIFIIGAHKKNVVLMKTYYIYDLVQLIIQILLTIAGTIFFMYVIFVLYQRSDWKVYPSAVAWSFGKAITLISSEILLKAYGLLLVRSEIIKLRSHCEFRFVNNAAEPAYILVRCINYLMARKQ